jgi:hypothetical protein
VTLATWQVNTTKEQSDSLFEAYAELHHNFEDFQEKKGISGYYYLYNNRMTGAFLHKGEHAGKAKATAIWEPVLKKLTSFPNMIQTNFTVVEYPSFKTYFDARFGAIDGGSSMAMPRPWDQAGSRLVARHGPEEMMKEPVAKAITNLDSRLLGAKHFQDKNLTAALRAAFPSQLEGKSQILQGHLVSGNKVHRPDEDVPVAPAWRTALSHVIGYKVQGKSSVDSLRVLAPETGAYANEVCFRLFRKFL